MTKTNVELKKLYDEVYKTGKSKFFTFDTFNITEEILIEADWKNKKILEIGCGTGETAFEIAKKGGDVLAVDYSEEAITIAKEKHKHKNLKFETKSLHDVKGSFDIVIFQEVLEHTDDPLDALSRLSKLIKEDGLLLVTCPSFMNIRGYIWMTLVKLFDVPMSLTDLHFICPFDMEEWAKSLNLKLKWRTIDYSRGNGPKMIIDMDKRLKNALRDAKMNNSKVDDLMKWFEKVIKYDHRLPHAGAIGIYHLTKK